ncbi:MAG: hypothetical protein R3245_11435 [Kiloniellales bacterium]|nr:hypothetical protein [Kiloniellales bacterium]
MALGEFLGGKGRAEVVGTISDDKKGIFLETLGIAAVAATATFL